MKYKNYTIQKQTKIQNGTFVDDGYDVFAPFNKTDSVHHSETSEEAKAWEDSQVALTDASKKRYTPVHYSRYYWVVSDNERGGLYVRKEDGKLLLFNKHKEAFDWCVENN